MLSSPLDYDAERVVTAVLISSFEYDHVYFDALFCRTNWQLFSARTNVEALNILNTRVVPVILVDERVEPDGWKSVLDATQMLPYRPKLIVASLLTTDGIWADVLNLGGYDLLVRPLNQEEVLHSISMAWLAWKHDTQQEAARLKKAPQQMTEIGLETSGRNLQWRAAGR